MNNFVDSVLRTIYHPSVTPGRSFARRRIIFTSFCPDVCAVLNWKQPNYPVFFGTPCGKRGPNFPSPTSMSISDEYDRRSSSLGAAVEFSKNNNLLGVFVNADLLVPVPSLIQGIRDAGLLVGVYGSKERSTGPALSVAGEDNLVDAVFRDGLVACIEQPSLEMI